MPQSIVVGSDHAGFELKEKLKKHLQQRGFSVEDVGTHAETSVDYPTFAHELASAVAGGRFERGVLVCGSGIGISIAANRHRGVRAALVHDETTARLAREHNNANVLAMGGRTTDHQLALRLLDIWLDTPFAGGRHADRVGLIEPGEAKTEVK